MQINDREEVKREKREREREREERDTKIDTRAKSEQSAWNKREW